MLECLGIVGNNAGNIATSARHTLLSDDTEGLVATLQSVRDLLPQEHPMSGTNLLRLRGINNSSGQLDMIVQISDRMPILNGRYARAISYMKVHGNYSDVLFLLDSLMRGVPVLTSIDNRHVVLVTGLDSQINRIRYWDVNIGEVEEDFVNGFTNRCPEYVTLA